MSKPLSPIGGVDQHTLGHLDCPACERAKTLLLSRISPSLKFSVAASLWLESRCFNISDGYRSARRLTDATQDSYRAYIRSLNLFFADIPLDKIHLGHMQSYQEARITGAEPFVRFRRPQDAKPRLLPGGVVLPPKGKTSCPASAKKTNQELSTLRKIMTRAGCWTPEMQEFFEPLAEDYSEVPKALSERQQELWIETSRLRERWWIVHWYSILAFGTSMGTNEMRWLRIGDLNLHHEIAMVQREGAKNRHRSRTIPLVGADVLWAADQLLRRAYDLGSRHPHHYVFPFCLGRKRGSWGETCLSEYDPARPMTVSGIKAPWDEVRNHLVSARPDDPVYAGFHTFTPYCTRHTALTRWAEAGMEPYKLKEMAGHVTEQMMRHYARISEASKRKELERAMGKGRHTAVTYAPRVALA